LLEKDEEERNKKKIEIYKIEEDQKHRILKTESE
jgi:hypothetical protein